MSFDSVTRPRHLVLVLGDQLDASSAALDGFDPLQDAVWMAEVAGEGTHVWSHKARIALFLSGMRHAPVLRRNPRMTMQLKNLDRLAAERRLQIRQQADRWRSASATHS
jgi:deoxyribodipyrimidine photolyase-related protein